MVKFRDTGVIGSKGWGGLGLGNEVGVPWCPEVWFRWLSL